MRDLTTVMKFPKATMIVIWNYRTREEQETGQDSERKDLWKHLIARVVDTWGKLRKDEVNPGGAVKFKILHDVKVGFRGRSQRAKSPLRKC